MSPFNFGDQVDDFAESLRKTGIHVGLSIDDDEVRCVTCGEPWPCSNSTNEVATTVTVPPIVCKTWQMARELVANGRDVEYSEGGNSMLPLIKSRQPVTLSPVDAAKLEKGDIVLVKVNRNVYTHLVKGLRQGQVLIGNNRGRINGWTSLANVFAIVTAVDGVPIASAAAKVARP